MAALLVKSHDLDQRVRNENGLVGRAECGVGALTVVYFSLIFLCLTNSHTSTHSFLLCRFLLKSALLLVANRECHGFGALAVGVE